MATTLEMYGGIQTVQVIYIHVQDVRLCNTSHHIKPSHVKLERVIAVSTAKSHYIQSNHMLLNHMSQLSSVHLKLHISYQTIWYTVGSNHRYHMISCYFMVDQLELCCIISDYIGSYHVALSFGTTFDGINKTICYSRISRSCFIIVICNFKHCVTWWPGMAVYHSRLFYNRASNLRISNIICNISDWAAFFWSTCMYFEQGLVMKQQTDDHRFTRFCTMSCHTFYTWEPIPWYHLI